MRHILGKQPGTSYVCSPYEMSMEKIKSPYNTHYTEWDLYIKLKGIRSASLDEMVPED